ncbi:MAG: LytTR family transcriptional regulator DNA-binding domain-containing protein [Chitinophagales bacterium]|nr:LytTR family transcriptional regulator DNA-binding domain-containing protein [Bacteroidota bacterium]MCB9227836.1 LytTR family transcriptional regulator DNA-binding domain-containing protein [Chitinophagales bacterium]
MDVLIIANNEKSADYLENIIGKFSEFKDNIQVCIGLDDATTWLQDNDAPDIIFNVCDNEIEEYYKMYQYSDIHSALVFIASNDKHIQTSYLFNTLNFITDKPKLEDIKFCFDKYNTYFKDKSDINYVRDLQKLTKLISDRDKKFKKRFMVRVGNVFKYVTVTNIAYFYSHDRINYIVNIDGRKFPLDNTLDEVELMLNPVVFFRANRQFIININSISEIHPYFKGRVKLKLEPPQEGELIISAGKSRSFKDWLDE